MKLLAPIIVSSSMAAVSAGHLRNKSKSRHLGVVFDTEEEADNFNFKEMRIVGGEDANEGDFGYTVSLEDDIGHFCGATLVRQDIVISAAHCAGRPMDMWARVGANNISRNEGTRIKVKKQIKHKNYDPDTENYDFMILVLEDPAPEDVPLARLHDEADLGEGDSLTVIGWGNMDPNGGWDMPDTKQHVEVKYIPNDDCNSRDSYNDEITNAMLCAGEKEGGEDACKGDSGGPLVRLGSGGSQDELVGVVSWGSGCASARHPGVYARITEVRSWIDDTINKESKFSSVSDGDTSNTTSTRPATMSTEEQSQSSPTQSSYSNPNWRTVLYEDFEKDFGQNRLDKGGNHARQYYSAYGKKGIARIQNGKGNASSFSTKDISTRRSVSHNKNGNTSSSDWRVSMEFQGIGMEEHEDRFCVQLKVDNGPWTDLKCYMSGVDFNNEEWLTETITFSVHDTAESIRVRWICEANKRNDDVIFDWIELEAHEA